MSTFANAVFAESDDENDPDFVPEDASDTSGEELQTTKLDSVETEAQKAEKEKARVALWESFQASVVGTGSPPRNTSQQPAKLVKIERRYRFAGEEVSEVVEVPEDSEDAKKWPRWAPQATRGVGTSTDETLPDATKTEGDRAGSSSIEVASQTPNALQETSLESSSGPTSSTVGSKTPADTTNKPPRPKPGPRKPRTTLAPLPTTKPKKLTTLEKSAMDWRAHVAQSDAGEDASPGGVNLADELERNRRSGGYLEKVAFLERVGNRREDLFEESRKKRRKA